MLSIADILAHIHHYQMVTFNILLYLRHFDDIRIDAVRRAIKAAIRSPVAVLPAGFALWAAMSIHTLGIVAFQPKATRSHASDGSKSKEFRLG